MTHLRSLVAWLERAGHKRIVLLDNASTYQPLLDYYQTTPHTVVSLGANLGSRALWLADLVPDEPFVYSDPDLVPTADCPLDAIGYLVGLLDRFDVVKTALGLHLDDLPSTLNPGIVAWERELVSANREIAPGVYGSLSDTTLAAYRAGADFTLEALRTAAPYQARHMPWYVSDLGDEDRYYLDRATPGPAGSSWKEAIG